MWNIVISESVGTSELIIVYSFEIPSHQRRISRTLLSILADLKNAVVWMVSIHPFISKSSSSCTNLWWLYGARHHQIITIITIIFKEFLTPTLAVGVWETESLLKFPGFFNILADLNNAVVWMISIRPVIFKSSSPCTNTLVTVLSAPIPFSINVNFSVCEFFTPALSAGLSLEF